MIFLLLTTLLLSNLSTHTRAEIAGWPAAGQALDETADEARDAEILRAVVTSMKEWSEKHNRTRIKRSQGSRVCYDQLGCFEDSGPFGYLEMLPSPPQEINTRFLLYSTKSRGDIPLLDVPFGNLSAAWRWADRAFNSSSPTKVIVHGFGSNCDHVWVYEMRSALMAVEECNVICVDWEAGALVPNYVRAAANTRLVGKQLAMLLEGLADHINLRFDKVHLIGFSLGAHVAGFAGSQLKNISRITGLDPAGPLFEAQDPRARLDSNDAMFVDVIHSNGENLILGGLGSWQPMGHVDFYPNGGRMQTGCSNLFVGAVTDIIWSSAIEGRSLCNHRRAYKFFTDSVSPKCHFPSFPCDTYDDFLAGRCFGCNGGRRCGNMGYYADRASGRGQMYLLTREEEPFCAHQYYVRVESSKINQTVVSYGRILLTLVGDSGLNETFPLTRKDDAELTRGGVLSRMLVPHPALGIPVKVQLHYQAYSGWISSGLTRWTIDKVLLSDSFGKSSSMCKKGLNLNSGAPVTLPLYPGDCNHPKTADEQTTNSTNELESSEKNVDESNTLIMPSFIPTQVVRIGDEIIGKTESRSDSSTSTLIKREDIFLENLNGKMKSFLAKDSLSSEVEDAKPSVIPMGKHFRIDIENKTSDPLLSLLDAADILNLPWQPLLANSLDNTPNERESGRAFGSINKKYNSFPFFQSNANKNMYNQSEIVEPVLKIPATKNARSHDIHKVKKEITEPILGPTSIRPKLTTAESSNSKPPHVRTNRAHKPYEFSSVEQTEDADRSENIPKITIWTPSDNLLPPETEDTNIWNQLTNNTRALSKSGINNTDDIDKKIETTTKGEETFSLFQWQSREKKEISPNKNTDTNFTVQFLPSRLVWFLEKAEKYARNTLLPLVSAYTPRFLFFGKEVEETEGVQRMNPKYVPLEENLPDAADAPVLEQTQEQKMNLILNMGPPNTTESVSRKPTQPKVQSPQYALSESTTHKQSLLDQNGIQNIQSDPIKIVKAPTMTTTTLPSVTLTSDGNSLEKIIIVYPSNARDDRKIQSQSFPEIMQFESLYQQSVTLNQVARSSKNDLDVSASQHYEVKNVDDVHIDLPTYEPPTTNSPRSHKITYTKTAIPNFIPVSYPSEIRSHGPKGSNEQKPYSTRQ